MAIELPAKKYYTFLELALRLQCSDQDLRHLLIEGEIAPSILLENGLYCDYQIQSNEEEDGIHLWPSQMFDCESSADELGTRTQLGGFYFLIFPRLISATSCEFNYASNNPYGHGEGDICYLMEKPYSLDYILKFGAVMAGELGRFEALHSKNNVSVQAEKPLGTSERNQLLKMVIGMAMDSYGHDPKALKSNAANQIADDLSKYGIKITDDTVRKYLKEAANTVTYTMPKT